MMSFLLCEVESILSDKPLTTATDDPSDTEPLIPDHLLLMKKPTVLPPGLTKREDSYTRRQWKQLQYLAVLFWKWWVGEYLPMLQEQQKWSWIKKNVSWSLRTPRSLWVLEEFFRWFQTPRDLYGMWSSFDKRCLICEMNMWVWMLNVKQTNKKKSILYMFCTSLLLYCTWCEICLTHL